MPIGISDYKSLIDENACYVDKTLLIKDIIDDTSKVLVFTRPRRFGKTLNLSMLYYYFNKSGDDNSYLFCGKKIFQHGERYSSERGKYPVIYLTLKDIKQSTWESGCKKLIMEISSLFIGYKYLLNSNVLEGSEKAIFNEIFHGTGDIEIYQNSVNYTPPTLRSEVGASCSR